MKQPTFYKINLAAGWSVTWRASRSRRSSWEDWKQVTDKEVLTSNCRKERKSKSWTEFEWNTNSACLLTRQRIKKKQTQGLQSGGLQGSCFLRGCHFISLFNCQTSFVVVYFIIFKKIYSWKSYAQMLFLQPTSALTPPLKWFWQRSPKTWLLSGAVSFQLLFSWPILEHLVMLTCF